MTTAETGTTVELAPNATLDSSSETVNALKATVFARPVMLKEDAHHATLDIFLTTEIAFPFHLWPPLLFITPNAAPKSWLLLPTASETKTSEVEMMFLQEFISIFITINTKVYMIIPYKQRILCLASQNQVCCKI